LSFLYKTVILFYYYYMIVYSIGTLWFTIIAFLVWSFITQT
jgi:hypothetical protein